MTITVTDPIVGQIKKLGSYAEQARYFANRMRGGETGEWAQTGWVRLINGAVKPVYLLNEGTPVVLLGGHDPRKVTIASVDINSIRKTEEECY